jgi:hypothetical protein
MTADFGSLKHGDEDESLCALGPRTMLLLSNAARHPNVGVP